MSGSVPICHSISFSVPLKERNKNEYYFMYSPVLLLGQPVFAQVGLEETCGVCLFDKVTLIYKSSL